MTPVALLTTDLDSHGFDDECAPILLAAMRAAGYPCELISWHDDDADWSSYAAVIIRSPWDYSENPTAFLHWLNRVEAAGVPVLNHPSIIRWNLDKQYLAQLADMGIAVVPTEYAADLSQLRQALAALAATQTPHVVIKPSISAGSADTGLFATEDLAAQQLAEHILGMSKVVMVQPGLQNVTQHGEVAVFFFGGEYSHAVAKGPLLELGGKLRGGTYQEQLSLTEPTTEQLALAQCAETAIRTLTGQDPLYARIDLATSDSGAPLVLEIEAFEPSYFAHLSPVVAQNFVRAVRARIGS